MIKYIGSKRKLLNNIFEVASNIVENQSANILDLFSGTARVGHMFKSKGWAVTSNDHNMYAYLNALCYVQADLDVHTHQAQRIIAELNRLPPRAGFITETYCIQSKFFQPKNGERIDAIRERIEDLCLSPEMKAVVLVSLIEAADRVDSTTGVQMSYLKSWSSRSFKDLEMRLPTLLPRPSQGGCFAFKMDALECIKKLSAEVDIVYLDPPYNQHKYHSNYHIWETLALWDKPEVYGVACKRIDGKEKTSGFYSKKACKSSFADLINACQSRSVIVSFNNEGYLDKTDIENCLLAKYNNIHITEVDFARYIGHSIGKHNKEGYRVGESSHSRNIEYLFTAF